MNTEQLSKQLEPTIKRAVRYRALLFFIALSIVYGYVITRIAAYNNVVPPSNAQQAKQVHLKPSVVSKIQQLQENSVSAQALFEEARNNPFAE